MLKLWRFLKPCIQIGIDGRSLTRTLNLFFEYDTFLVVLYLIVAALPALNHVSKCLFGLLLRFPLRWEKYAFILFRLRAISRYPYWRVHQWVVWSGGKFVSKLNWGVRWYDCWETFLTTRTNQLSLFWRVKTLIYFRLIRWFALVLHQGNLNVLK